MYREKNIKSGKIFEAEFYPIFDGGRRLPTRAPKTKPSKKEQQNLNAKNARKKLCRLINTNFDKNDLAVHGTYRDAQMPSSEQAVRHDIVNYIRRIKNFRKKNGLTAMKYIYVIEAKVSKRTGALRWHWHMIMSGMDRDAAEKLWPYGDWVNADRLQPGDKGFDALANYLSKDPQGQKRWAQSKNLKKPTELKPKDGKITKIGVRRMATLHIDDAAYWERRYKGYKFIECEALWNDYNLHWYVSVTMRKKE